MQRIVQAAGKQEVLLFELSLLDPRLHGISGGRCDLELHRPMGFVLHHDGACGHLVIAALVPHLESNEVTSSQLAVDAEIEEREFAHTAFHLQADSKSPDVLGFERGLLPGDLALAPWPAMSCITCSSHDGLPSS